MILICIKLNQDPQIEVISMKRKIKNNEQFIEAISFIRKNDNENLKRCLGSLLNVDEQDEDGRTLIYYSINGNNIEALKIILDFGGDVNLKDHNGLTPLHFATIAHDPLSIELLLKHHADVNAQDNNGNTVISEAIFNSRGRGEVIKILIAANADLDIKNNYGISARELTETIGNYDIKQFLE